MLMSVRLKVLFLSACWFLPGLAYVPDDSEDGSTLQELVVLYQESVLQLSPGSQVGEACESNLSCAVEHSLCIAGTCICSRGYVLAGTECVTLASTYLRRTVRAYLIAAGCLLSLLIFASALCVLYWKRKIDDRRDMEELDVVSNVRRVGEPTWMLNASEDRSCGQQVGRIWYIDAPGRVPPSTSVAMAEKPPSYEDAVNKVPVLQVAQEKAAALRREIKRMTL
ncbi:uncharacterized protein LOC135389801 [Ornithodoros turicata]|uniref:uncharacterized protein LOC135389801 n=1 Tax=Ornithodoros turicata TaxID=34597 RepID=UPI003139F483